MANRWGNNGNSVRLYFLGLQYHCGQWLQPRNQKMLALWKKAMTNLDSVLKSRDICLPTNFGLVKAMGFFSRHVWMWEVYSVVSNSVRPQRWQPTRLCRPWDSPGKNTGMGCHFLLQCIKVKSKSEVAQSCPTLSDPMDYSQPGSSVHGIFQARVLEWGAIAFSGF